MLFGGLGAEELDTVAASATPRTVRAGQAVFRQGGEPTHLDLLVEGRVKVGQVIGSGASLTIRFIGPGDVPGCGAVFRRISFPATATAVVDSRLFAWPTAHIGQPLEQQPRGAANAVR